MSGSHEGVPEYVAKSRILREVYSELPEEVRRELDVTVRDLEIRVLARVTVEYQDTRFGVYALVYEVSDDGAEWVTIVRPKSVVHFRVHDGIIWFNGREYLPKNPDVALRLVERILRRMAGLRNGDPRISTAAETYVEEFKMLRGERL